jgi:hypothetical protein
MAEEKGVADPRVVQFVKAVVPEPGEAEPTLGQQELAIEIQKVVDQARERWEKAKEAKAKKQGS